MRRAVLRALTVYRWIALVWMTAVAVELFRNDRMQHPDIAVVLVSAATLVTVVTSVFAFRSPELLEAPATIAIELAVGLAVVVADGWVYRPGHAFSLEQNLGVGWPMAGVLAAGATYGAWAGGASGVAYGIARTLAVVVNTVRPGTGTEWISLLSSGVMFTAAGAMAGLLVSQIERVQREVSAARAREEVARTLHDGVLQTLAVIERRTDDPELAALARSSERDLRAYLLGATDDATDDAADTTDRRTGGRTAPAHRSDAPRDLALGLADVAGRYETAYGGRSTVVISPDVATPPDDIAAAILGAVGEAMTNAGKHGGATHVTVFVEPDDTDDGWFCSVKDDGCGFEPATVTERIGMTSSIRGRIDDVNGSVEFDSRPGAGCEVRIAVPAPPRRRMSRSRTG